MLTESPRLDHAIRVYQRSELIAAGWHGSAIAAAVRDGRLIRARGGCYLGVDTPADVVTAVRIGGRLTCTSELARRGVFVRARDAVHVHLPRSRSRLRRVDAMSRLHWRPLVREPHPRSATVEVFDALLHAVECEQPRDAVATIDSALHLGLLRDDELDELFSHVGKRRRALRGLVDGRAESGTETLVRLMLRALGARVEIQVRFDGIGRVDLVVDGWLVVECDSEAHHGGWEAQRRDRRRDQALAALGYSVYRPIAEDILFHPEVVVAALRGLLGGRRRRVGNQAQRG